MTAQIAVMNKSAVALAADSAVTIGRGGKGEKTYNVNKLFTLSKFRPVGIMVYANAELMGLPWETLIKAYRVQLAKKSFNTIYDYSMDFLNFIAASPLFFPPKHQSLFVRICAESLFAVVKDEATSKVEQETEGGGTISEKRILEIFESAANELADDIRKMTKLPTLPKNFATLTNRTYVKEIEEAAKSRLTGFPRKVQTLLKRLVGECFARGCLPMNDTGVVIAGFGDEEIIPSLAAFRVSGVVRNTLIYRQEKDKSHPNAPNDGTTLFGNSAAVVPFAQTDVVETFVEGMAVEFRAEIGKKVQTLFEEFQTFAETQIGRSKRAREISANLKAFRDNQVRKLLRELREKIVTEHVQPLLDVVDVLPKDELANLASALVELTSIKRKMSLALETVGGPIDVAVISKGDGFVWISRKHYFDPKLNTQFVPNYVREIVDGGKS